MSHVEKNKHQKLELIIDAISSLADRYENPVILPFGDFNMSERAICYSLQKQSLNLAKMGLKLANNYQSP